MVNKIKYIFESLGFGNLSVYFLLRPFRKFLLKKDSLLYIHREISYAKSIYKSIEHNNIKRNKEYSYKIEEYYSQYNKVINKNWHYCYANSTGNYSVKYIPLINYTDEIEPYLNRIELVDAYDDKNMYDKIFDNVLTPVSLVRCINGRYFDQQYQRFESPSDAINSLAKGASYIIKPSLNSQGGHGIHKLTYDGENVHLDKKVFKIYELPKLYRMDFVIQKFLKQHEDLNSIYPHSVNTIRIMTFRHKEQIIILSHIIRFGADGAFMDNLKTGGISCGITSDGFLKKLATGKNFQLFEMHPHNNIRFEGIKIPGFDKVKEVVISLHNKLHYFDIVSWDIAINPDGDPVLIEMNLSDQGINYLQALNGPLFGNLTDEILEKVYLPVE